MHTAYSGNLNRRNHLTDTGIYEYNIKTNLRKMWGDGVDWIQLAQDTVQWWVLAYCTR